MFPRLVLSLALALTLACSSTSSGGLASVAAQGLMGQMGGMDSMSRLARNFVNFSAEDPHLTGLLSDTLSDANDRDAFQLRLADQLCSMLGGSCAPPVTGEQIAAGAARLNPEQTTAVNENLTRTLGEMHLAPTLKDAVTSAIGPKLPGIVGALL